LLFLSKQEMRKSINEVGDDKFEISLRLA